MTRTVSIIAILAAGLLASSACIADPPATEPAGEFAVGREGAFTSGLWAYEYRISGKGTRSEGQHGVLSYDGKPVPDAEAVNDWYNTPWGKMYWAGRPRVIFGDHGWMPKPNIHKPEGKALADPGAAPATQPATKAATQAVGPLEIGMESCNKPVYLKAGQDLIVHLKGNPTTGFQWELTPVTDKAVEAVGTVDYAPDAAPAGKVGVGGQFTAKFHAAAEGQSVITMVYRRPWEKDVKPVETFTVTVNVKE